MMKRTAVIFITIILLVFLFLKFIGVSDKNKNIAQVNGVGIKQAAYDKKLEESINFFKSQKQDIPKLTTLQKDTTDELINESLINQYAEKNKILVLDSEINARYAQTVAGFNRRNNIKGEGDESILLKIKEMYGIQKNDYLQILKMDILKEKVQASVKMPLAEWLLGQKKSADIKIL